MAVGWNSPVAGILAIAAAVAILYFIFADALPQKQPPAPTPQETLDQRAAAGDPEAQYNFALLHTSGVFAENPDYETARQWHERAAAQGHMGAHYALGVIYHQGFGVEIDIPRAITHYELAAQSGDRNAQDNLSGLYLEDKNDLEKVAKAIFWIKKAAENNSLHAQKRLAWIYDKGIGAPASDEKARIWYEKAAATGDPWAQDNLCGLLHRNDQYSAARPWCEKGAARDSAMPAGILAFYYLHGHGVTRDMMKAGEYFKRGMKGDDPYSTEYLVAVIGQCRVARTDENGRFSDRSATDCLVAAGAGNVAGQRKASIIYGQNYPALNIRADMIKAAQLKQLADSRGGQE